MASINLGCSFDNDHVEVILSLKENEDNFKYKLAGVYGSPAIGNPFGSVRPLKRESEVNIEQFKANMLALREAGLEVNLTMNSLFPHIKASSQGLMANVFDNTFAREELNWFVNEYKDYVTNWIIASPYLVECFHKFPRKWNLNIICSTIMNIHSLPQLQYIKENWPLVKRVCTALWRNREFNWLYKANKIIPIEVLTNEFCSIGGVECEGLYRQACYLAQSTEIRSWNPMKSCCIESRRKKPWAWLMARFILPQWIDTYKSLGIGHYKVTGRTHEASYIRAIGETYLKGEYSGNLLSLWGQLEATLDKENWAKQQKKAIDGVYISTSEIERSLLSQIGNCTADVCGFSCDYCKRLYEKVGQQHG